MTGGPTRFTAAVLVALACLAARVHADERIDLDALSALERFAIDGMDTGRPIMNQDPQVALDEFGLPARIDIHHGLAAWDIDIEETPAEWMYEGFSITAPYLRSADTSTGEWVPLNYRPGRFIDEMSVFDARVPARMGLRVGAHADIVLELLNLPPLAEGSARIYTLVETDELIGRNVEIVFHLDATGQVTSIVWRRAPWH